MYANRKEVLLKDSKGRYLRVVGFFCHDHGLLVKPICAPQHSTTALNSFIRNHHDLHFVYHNLLPGSPGALSQLHPQVVVAPRQQQPV